jgi:hypothetical protein
VRFYCFAQGTKNLRRTLHIVKDVNAARTISLRPISRVFLLVPILHKFPCFQRSPISMGKITKILLFKKINKYNMKYLHTNIKCILMNFVGTGSLARQGYDPRPRPILPSKELSLQDPISVPTKKISRL